MSVPEFANYIDGQWVSGSTFENRNPANTGEVVGLFVKGTAGDMQRAAAAAEAAFPGMGGHDGAGAAATSCSRWPTSSTAV